MTNSSNSPNSNDQPSPKNNRQWEEFIAVIVALLGIGSIFFWIILRDNSALTLKSPQILVSSPPSSQPSAPAKISNSKPNQENQPKLQEITPSATKQNSSKFELDSQGVTGINSTHKNQQNLPQTASVSPEITPNNIPETAQNNSENIPAPNIPTTSEAKTTTPRETNTPPHTPPEEFSDVPEDYWAKPAIQSLLTINIIAGFPDGSFRPNAPVTRAELAAQLQKVFDHKPKQKAINYKDIPPDYWAAEAINQVAESGFLRGYPGEIFQPEQKVPRVQVLVALASGLNLNLPSQPEGVIKKYQDAQDIPNYALQKVAAATQNRLVVNYPDLTLLRPNQPATRAEVAVMIHQALALNGEVEPLNNAYIVSP